MGMNITSDTVIVIIGASSGVGRALALSIAEKKAKIVLAARREDSLKEVAMEVERRGGTPRWIVTDVTLKQDVEYLIQKSIEIFSHIDILVNSAGMGMLASLQDLKEDEVHTIMAVNLYGPLYAIQAVLPHMLKRKSGHIISIGSLGGKLGLPFNAAYSMSKFALVGLHRVLRAELFGTGVYASLLLPGRIKTEFHKKAKHGDIGEVAVKADPLISKMAEKYDLEIPEFPTWILSSQDVADAVIEIIRNPVAEYYTHPGTKEMVMEMERDPEVYEKKIGAFLLAMREAYKEVRKK